MGGIKWFSPAIFALVIICFFLPFVNISCQGQKIATLSGIQLVTGTTIKQSDMFGRKENLRKVESEPLAVLAFLSGFLGLGLSFLRGRRSSIAPAIAGVVGLVFLLLLKSKLDNDILKEGEGVLELEYGVGFWLVFLFFLFAIGLNAFLFFRREQN